MSKEQFQLKLPFCYGTITNLVSNHKLLCVFFQSILAPLVQIPLFISFFMALRKMCYLPVESLQTGGYLWFQDLTVFDPYFILPVICSFSMLASLEVRVGYITKCWAMFPGGIEGHVSL